MRNVLRSIALIFTTVVSSTGHGQEVGDQLASVVKSFVECPIKPTKAENEGDMSVTNTLIVRKDTGDAAHFSIKGTKTANVIGYYEAMGEKWENVTTTEYTVDVDYNELDKAASESGRVVLTCSGGSICIAESEVTSCRGKCWQDDDNDAYGSAKVTFRMCDATTADDLAETINFLIEMNAGN